MLCHGSVQGACSASEAGPCPEPCEAQGWLRPWHSTLCTVTGPGHAAGSRERPPLLWAAFGSCCTPNQQGWDSQPGLQDGSVCAGTPSSPTTITEFPSLSSAAERMDCLCCSNKSPQPLSVTPCYSTQQIRVTSMDSQVPSGLLG